MSGAQIRLTFLGTGSAIPGNDRKQVCLSLKHEAGTLLFDCGEGTQYSLRKYGIPTRKQFVICISHLHSDHFLGLPGLLSSFQLLKRERKIIIVGPEGIKSTVKNLILANYVNIDYPLEVISLKPGEQFEGEGYSLSCFKAVHEGNALSFVWKENNFPGKVDVEKLEEYGIPEGPLIGKLQAGEDIRVNDKIIKSREIVGPPRRGRVVLYSGDTAYNNKFHHHVPDEVDVLVHEATYANNMTDLAKERYHSTVIDAAKIASKVKPTQLILTHISPRITNLDAEINKSKKIFKHIIAAEDGMEYDIDYPY